MEGIKSSEYYEFIPLAEAPHSLLADYDKQHLILKGCLENSCDWVLLPTDKRFAVELDFFEKIALQELKNKWLNKTEHEVSRYITSNYPYYLSECIDNSRSEPTLYTIGYEGASPEAYINTLLKNNIRLLCDVRRNPISKKFGFSKMELGTFLPKVGIEYTHIPELGIASEKRQSLHTDKDYENLFRQYEIDTLPYQSDKLKLLQMLLEEKCRVAITCFEADPSHCHRSSIVKVLKEQKEFQYRIEHLYPCVSTNKNQKGNIMTHKDLIPSFWGK